MNVSDNISFSSTDDSGSTTDARKSSFSADANCVEVAINSGKIMVTDTKNPDGPALGFTPNEWSAFVAGVRNGEFDLRAQE